MKSIEKDEILKTVRQHYARAAKQRSRCCDSTVPSSCCETRPSTDLGSNISERFVYSEQDTLSGPEGAYMGLGCGNPLAVAVVKSGETVLDLGSGGGFDCFLAAKQVGEGGHVIGVDMTPEMVSKARAQTNGFRYKNVEFRLGELENLPVADESVDVVISNCVINLSPDKPRVYSEAFRVLKPGGRLAVADMIATAPLPPEIKKDLSLYVGCIAGAVFVDDLKNILSKAGFYEIKIKIGDDSRNLTNNCAKGTALEDCIKAAMIEAVRPR